MPVASQSLNSKPTCSSGRNHYNSVANLLLHWRRRANTSLGRVAELVVIIAVIPDWKL